MAFNKILPRLVEFSLLSTRTVTSYQHNNPALLQGREVQASAGGSLKTRQQNRLSNICRVPSDLYATKNSPSVRFSDAMANFGLFLTLLLAYVQQGECLYRCAAGIHLGTYVFSTNSAFDGVGETALSFNYYPPLCLVVAI